MSGDKTIFQEYIEYHEKYIKKYDKDTTIILMQVGSFYEAYSIKTKGPDLSKISNILNIVLTRKNKNNLEIDESNYLMLGFPTFTLPKFLKLLLEENYTIVVVSQVTNPPHPKREITGIYSPGTYVEELNTIDSNNVVSIYIEEEKQINKKKNIICAGMCAIDFTTGKNVIYESYSSQNDTENSINEIIRFIHTYQPKEIILDLVNFTLMSTEQLINYLDIINTKNHINMSDLKNTTKIIYQTELLSKIFQTKNQLSIIETLDLENKNYARVSYVNLLTFAIDHNINIVNKLIQPEIYQNNKYLNLSNNAMYQLDVITNGSEINKYKLGCSIRSLFDVVNNTSTSMGKRYLKDTLLNPIIDRKELQHRYDAIEKIIKNNFYNILEEKLKNVFDIERLHRKIALALLNPCDFYNLMSSYEIIQSLISEIEKYDINLYNYLFGDDLIKNRLNKFIEKYEKIFNLEEMSKNLLNDIKTSFFINGTNTDIDKLQNEIYTCENFMNDLLHALNKYIIDSPDSPKSKNNDELLIKLEYNDRDGHYLLLTKKRANTLKKILSDSKSVQVNQLYSVSINDLSFNEQTRGNNCKIFVPKLNEVSSKIILLKEKLTNLVKNIYLKYLSEMYDNFGSLFNKLNIIIAKIDFLKSGAKTASLYKYCKPTFGENNKSFIKFENIRHPIIERISDNEYISTSLQIGKNNLDGVLLFGLNGAGKSSLMKSIGLSIILAQSGLYVPATKYEYVPYHNLFTRITGYDNIFKGQSTFGVEISELRSILKHNDQNTMVISDELASGTEHESAKIITLATIELLSSAKSSFISASHLHEIVETQKLKSLINVKCFNLHVDYDEIKNTFVYDRNLREGSGESFYGLNMAKYIINDDNFMSIANNIKNELCGNEKSIKEKTSNYNNTLYMTQCMICGKIPKPNEIPLETHHINPQNNCTEDGFLNNKPYIHKNHKSNLCVLCNTCHDMIERPINGKKLIIKGYDETSTGQILNYEYITIEDTEIIPIKKRNTRKHREK